MPQISQNVDLLPYNTMKVQSIASNYTEIDSVETLHELATQEVWNQPKLILGGGSNMLFVHNVDGLVIRNAIMGKEVVSETDDEVLVRVGGGEEWHAFVLYALEQGWAGIENLSLIPGTVGAAPIQNIGAYGTEIKDVFHSLEAFNMEEKCLEKFNKGECGFGYRDSIFKRTVKGKYMITSVTLSLSKNTSTVNTSYGALTAYLSEKNITEPSVKDISDAVIAVRQSKLPDPSELGNCGSFFKNPVIPLGKYQELKMQHPDIPGYEVSAEEMKVPAGWLIEHAGLKGITRGEVGTYPKQALVLVNYGERNGQKVLDFAQYIKSVVQEKFDVQLDPEVNII